MTPMLTLTRITAAMTSNRPRYGRKNSAIWRTVRGPLPGRAVRSGSAPPHMPRPRIMSSRMERKACAIGMPTGSPTSAARSRTRRLDLVPVIDLALMAAQRLESALHRRLHVDPQVRPLDAAHQHLAHLPGLQPLVQQLREVETVAGGRVDRRQRGLAGGQVIGMGNERVAVGATLRVLGDHQVRPKAADLPHDVASQLQAWLQVAVRIAEVHDLVDAQHVRRRALLGDTGGRQLLRRHRRVIGALAAIGGDDVVDACTGGGQGRDGRGGAELGVVRVAEDHERALQRRDQLVAFQVGHRVAHATPD